MIGVVIPAYNEEKNIAELVERISLNLQKGGHAYAICVVDDSPNDATEKIMERFSVRYIHRKVRDGRGSAVIEGLKALLDYPCDTFVEMDADFSHNPSELTALIEKKEKGGLDILIASRYLPESRIENWPVSRRLFSRAANMLAKFLLRVPVSDYTNGYRVYSRRAVEMIVKECGKIGKGFIPLSEILVQTYYRGLSVGEMPTVFVNRLRGESSLNAKEITNAFFGIWKIYALKFSLPMKRTIRGFIAAYADEVIIASLVLLGTLGMALLLFGKLGPLFYIKAGSLDIRGYMTLGQSIAEGKGFMYEGFVSAMRTPLYPLFVSLFYFFHTPLWFIPMVQNLITVVNAILVYRIGKLFLSRRSGMIAALMFGLEPFHLYHSNIVMSETPYLFFLLLSILIFGQWYIGGEETWRPIMLGITLGLTTLARPNVIFLPVIFVAFIVFRWYKKERPRAQPFPLRSIILSLLCMFFVILPWSLRQKQVFGSYRLTNLDTAILYTRVFPVVKADEWQVSAGDAYKRLMAELPEKIPNFDQNVLDHTFAYNAILEQEMKPEIPRHIPALIKAYLGALFPSGIISTGYQKLFDRLYPTWYLNDPNLLGMVKAGQYWEVVRALLVGNVFQTILLVGGLVWIGIYALMVAGILRAWKTVNKSHIIFFLCLVAYFTIFAIGPPVWARYRMIAYPFIFLLFALFFEQPWSRKNQH